MEFGIASRSPFPARSFPRREWEGPNLIGLKLPSCSEHVVGWWGQGGIPGMVVFDNMNKGMILEQLWRVTSQPSDR